MNFEAKFNSLNASLRKKLQNTQVSQEVVLKNEGLEIAKVLSVSAVPVISSLKVEGKSINIDGEVEYSVLYEKVDALKETITQTQHFSTVIECENAGEIENVCVKANLVDLAVKSTTVDRVELSALIEVFGYSTINNETKYLSDVEGDGTFFKKEDINYTKVKAKINQKYSSSQQIDISQTPLRLLNLTANGIINNISTAKGYITISGIIQYNICYEYALEEGVETKDIANTYNFRYEIDCPECEATDCAMLVLKSVKDGIRCEVASNENSNSLNLEVDFNICGEVYSNSTDLAVSDIFSIANKLQLTYDSFAYSKALGLKNYREKIYGVIESTEDNPRADKILCVLDSNAVITKAFCDDINLNIEGIAYTNVVYLNAEEVVESKMQIEIPFSFALPIEKENCNCEVCVSALVTDIMARIRRGREIEIDASMEMVAHFFATKAGVVISNIEALEEKVEKQSAFTIYIAKDNDSVWTIAKKMNISPDELVRQNPKLNNEINKGEKVIIYRKK